MIEVVCLNVGTKYTHDYEMRLYEALCRHTTTGFNFRIIRDEHFPGWWNKLLLFPPSVRTVFLDLDTVIVGNSDFLFAYEGPFCILEDFYYAGAYGSAVMSIAPGFGEQIRTSFLADSARIMHQCWGDQDWIRQQVPKADLWQQLYPGKIVSYKVHCQEEMPTDAALVCFHGEPKQTDLPQSHRLRRIWEQHAQC